MFLVGHADDSLENIVIDLISYLRVFGSVERSCLYRPSQHFMDLSIPWV